MIIKVLFFAQLKEALGEGERMVEIEEGKTVREFAQSLFKERGALGLKGLPLLYSIDEDFVDANRQLKNGDTLALLPPVAGG